jgi:RHS repeat-associated protein
MAPLFSPSLFAPAVRRKLYALITFVVIGSMLLHPLTVVAVLYKHDAVLQNAIEKSNRLLPSDAASRPIASDRQSAAVRPLRTIPRLPQPTVRTEALADPIPSGAKPAYPLNHLLDANPQVVGTPPQNHNFEAAAIPVGTPPTNHDFSAAAYEVGTPPTNATFETGTLSGWTTAGTVNIQSNATQGYFGRLQSGGILTSDAFTVDATAQEVAFEVGYLSTTNYSWFELYVLSGAGYATETKIAEDNCNNCGYWVTYGANVAAYAGQSIKLKFKRRFGNVGIDAVRMRVLLPGYTFPGKITRTEEGNGNVYVYARISKDHSVTTAAFTVDSSAQSATVSMTGASTVSDQYKIEVLSGPTFATATQVWVNTSTPDSWHAVQVNLAPWQGQSIKVRITWLYGAVGADDIALQQMIAPGWQMTDNPYVLTDPDSNRYLSTNGELLSDPFTLATDVQQISLRHRGSGSANTFFVKLLRGPTFGEEIDLAGLTSSATTGWQTLKIAVNLYAGETVKVKLVRHFGRLHFDDVAVGETILPGWQPTNLDPIATGEDGYGSYVTSDDGTAFIIRSSELSPGILNRSGDSDARYYAIAYNIGQATGSLLRVYWVDAQGNSTQLMQDAANTPTGYRIRYFPVYDFLQPIGRLVINVTNGGRVYSIGDNIARQQLNEPFSYKVGIQIDTASGAFGYQATDLRTAGVTPLLFTRYYNGHADRLGPLGYRWSHSYETRLIVTNDNDVGIIFGSGKEVFFIRNGTTFTPADARIYDTLVQNGDGSYTYTTKAKQQYNFTAAGFLSNSKDPNNNATTLAYDGNNRLTSVIAQGGATFTLAYDGNGRLTTVTDPLGAVVTYGYHAGGDLVSATRPASGVEQYSYNNHRLTQVVDALGNALFQNSFDAWHRVVQQTDAAGKTLAVAYSTPAAGVTSVTDPEGGVTKYYFDAFQRTTDWMAPTGQTTSYLYDNVGNLQKVIDGGAGQWNFAYDANGNLLNSQDPLGNPTQFTYNPQYLPTTVTDAKGNVTTFAYDAKGNVTQVTDALGGITTFTYNAAGNLLTQTNPLNHTESYTYDAAGNRLTRTNALGHTWQWTYNAANRVTSETNPNGHTTQYFYDLFGRVVGIRNHLGGERIFLYDPMGHLLMMEDELGRRTFWDYDNRGLVEAKIDPAGKTTTYSYDDNRNMANVTDPVGLTTTYEFDASNRLKKVIWPGGATTQYTYDGAGRLATETDALGRVTSYSYDSAGRLLAAQYPNGATYTYQYDVNGNQTRVTDPLNRATQMAYDALDRLSTTTDNLGYVTTNSYDAAGRMIEYKNAANQSVFYGYDAADRMVSFTDGLGRVTQYGYDAAGNPTTTTSPLGQVSTTVYDALNRAVQMIDAAGNTMQYVYDAASQQTQVIRPTGATTSYLYDARGLLTRSTNPLNQSTNYSYDNAGRLSQMTDAANQSTTYTYNASGRLAAITNALGKTTTYGYDALGNRTTVTDPLGRTTTTTYDNMNRVVAITDAGNRTHQYGYDAAGQLVQTTSAAGRVTSYSYDVRGLLTSITNALGQSESYEYNSLGQRTKVIDPRGNNTLYGYDAAGQLTTMTDALGGVVSYAYDAGGRLTGLTNPNGKTTSFTYNLFGSALTHTDPLNRTDTNTYDQVGRLTSHTDARGVTVNYGYDALNRLTTLTHPNGANSYTYDAVGRLTAVTDPTGTTTYAFDPLSRVTGITTPQGTVGYTYNDANQRTGMTLPGGRTINYNYDTTGRLASIGDWASGVINYSFDADGNLTGLNRSNGVNSAYGYDNAGRLTNISHDGSGGNLLFTNYTLDANGNRTAMASNGGTETYTLDALNRLTNASYPNGDTAAYSYDANGNRLSQTFNGVSTNYTYDDAGQLLTNGATSYSYDANGNLITAGADTYTWDWANRMTGATVAGNSASYTYDAFDVRVSGAVNGASSTYLWDRLAQYPALVDDGVRAYLHGIGPQAQIDGSGNRHYLLADALASIRGVTDGSGALVGSMTYDAFGAIRSQTGAPSAFGYTGELYTAATGLLHLRARDLNPSLGRFLSADSVQPNAPGSQGYNLYAYVANNPTTWIDPSGHTAMAGIIPSTLATAIAALLYEARIPESWRAGNDKRMANMTFTVFSLIIICFLVGPCKSETRDNQNAIDKYGSDSRNGRRDWPLPDLWDLPLSWPRLPGWDLPGPGSPPGNPPNSPPRNPPGSPPGYPPGSGPGYPPGSGPGNPPGSPPGYPPSSPPGTLPGAGAGAGTGPIGPLLGAGCILNGIAGLTTDSYGYEGTPGQNANIATNVMYNMITCGMMGGPGGSGSNWPSGGSKPQINPTQENWPGTNLPRSFEIITSDGSRYWVHPNATEHMFELVRRSPAGNTNFSEQLLLESFDQAIVTARQQGFQYDHMYYIGNWELKFGAPRESGMLPVVFHALFKP